MNALTVPREDPWRVALLALAHLLNDWYMNYIQTLLPFLVAMGVVGVGRGTLLVTAFTFSSSLLQPLFGYLVDRRGQRWLVYAGTLWMGALLGLLGLVNSYPLLVALALLAGLGTAAFHPQASAMVAGASGRRRGFYQACFVTAGNVGWALTPLLVVPLVQWRGLGVTPLFVLPGAAVAALLALLAPRVPPAAAPGPRAARAPEGVPVPGPAAAEVAKIVLVVVIRSLAFFGLVAFLPLYFHLGPDPHSALAGSRLLFLMLFAGAMGGLVGGYLSDLVGRRAVIVGSLAAATPTLRLFLHLDGLPAALCLALGGAFLLASFSVTIVAAQEALGRAKEATAAGLMLGFGIGVGGMGVGLLGVPAERLGVPWVVDFLTWLPLAAAVLGLFLRGRRALPGENVVADLRNDGT
ncbi:MAG: MFS transporter [Firmicutes bacterium]|nr:MFS transporter [Bacillota bacterium]